MKKLISHFLFFLFPIVLSAQINDSDTLKVRASLSFTGFWQGGNVETLIYRANSDVSIKAGRNIVFKTKNSYVYQEFGQVKADEDILSLNFLYLNPDRKVYPLLLGFVSTNFRREIDIRYLLGAGATFRILNDKKNWLVFSVTTEYEQTDFSKSDYNRNEFDGKSSIDTFRGTIWVNGKYHMFDDKMIVSHESYFQPSLEQSNNYRWRADLKLEFPIWKYLNLNINYLQTFENIVIQNQKREDRFLTFGFTIKSY